MNILLKLHQLFTLLLIVLLTVKTIGAIFIVLFIKNKKEETFVDGFQDRIDIIVAAYNEEKVIVKTINNLLNTDYKNFMIFIVDDGSTDNTLKLLNLNYENHPQIKILSKANSGKSEAISYALTFSSAEIVTFIDADTQVQLNTLEKISECFKNTQIAAMSGYLKVQNLKNMLTITQNIEYIISYNLEREIFNKMGVLTTIPGAICAYRKKQLLKVGGFNNETLTEDCDVTFKLLKANLNIKNEKNVIAYTEAPESVRMFLRQRIRWDYGLIQNLLKHARHKFHINYKIKFIFFYSWLYKIGYTLLFAIADYLFLILIFFTKELSYYIFFLIMETLLALIVLVKENKELKLITIPFIFYRIIYRHLKFYSLVIITTKLVIRKKIQWKKIYRFNS